jgi:hypothetical protein
VTGKTNALAPSLDLDQFSPKNKFTPSEPLVIEGSRVRTGGMKNRTLGPLSVSDLRELFNDAWMEFAATSPMGIDLIAEASLRSMIAARIIRAANKGEVDRAALKARALRGF